MPTIEQQQVRQRAQQIQQQYGYDPGLSSMLASNEFQPLEDQVLRGVTNLQRFGNPEQIQQKYGSYQGLLASLLPGSKVQPTPTPHQPGQPVGAGTLPQTPQSTQTQGTPPNSSSVVDYLKSVGQDSSFTARTQLATKMGIQGYRGTAQQNKQLLGAVRGQSGSPTGGQPTGTSVLVPGTTGAAGTVKIGPGDVKITGGGAEDSATDSLLQGVQDIFKKYGLTPNDSSTSPHVSYTDYYGQVYNSLGLSQVKTQLDDNLKEFNKVQDELNTKVSEVIESPWLSQGIRDARIDQINRRYESKLKLLEYRQNYFQSQFEFGRDEARHAADKMLEVSHQGQEFNKELAFKMLDLVEKRIEAQNKLGLFKQEAVIREEEAEKLARFKAGLKEPKDISEGLSKSKIQKGAAISGMNIEDFKRLDSDTQNYFINNSSEIKNKKKLINKAKINKENPSDLEREISNSNLPDAVKDSFVKYLWSVFPRPTTDSKPWWKRIL